MRRLALFAVCVTTIAPAAGRAETTRSITFQDAVQRALEHNPTSAQAKAEVMRAQAVVEEVRAAMLPTLTANAVGTQLDAARTQGYTVVQPQSALNGNVQLNVPLVVPQRWAATSHAHQAVDVARLGEAETSRQLAYATAQAFLTATLQRRLLDNAVRARETAQSHFDYAHQRLVHGVGNRLDEARAEKELHEDLARVETNIVVVDTGAVPAARIAATAAESGVGLSAVGRTAVRAVTHLDVTAGQAREAGELVARLLG